MKYITISTFCFIMFLTASVLNAFDSTNVQPREKLSIGLRLLHPTIDGSNQFDILSGMYDFNITFPINPSWSISLNIPYSSYTMNDDNRSALGCISAGINYNSGGQSPFLFSGQAYLPTISEDDALVSILSTGYNIYEFPKYLWGGVYLHPYIEKRFFNSNGIYGGLGIGNILMIPTEEGIEEIEDYFNYCIKGGYDKMNSIGAELMLGGLFLATSDADDKFIHLLKLSIQYKLPNLVPKLIFMLPLDEDYSDAILNLIGFELTYYIR